MLFVRHSFVPYDVSMKKICVFGIIFVVLVVGYVITTSEDSDILDDIYFEHAVTTPASPQELSEGYQTKQAAFESLYAEFPSEKIVYTVHADGSTTPELSEPDAFLWSMVRDLAPSTKTFNAVTRFEVYYDENDTTLAAVESLDEVNKTWLYSINYIAVEDFAELSETLVHEYAHILGLEDSQTTTEAENFDIYETCATYLVEEGCTNNDSYLYNYYLAFWEGNEDYQEEDRDEDEAIALYELKPDEYVSDYAPTNPVEDFAETFMYFAMKNVMAEESIQADKIAFFNDFPELVDYRDVLHATVADWAR